jgi:hypothetical protein
MCENTFDIVSVKLVKHLTHLERAWVLGTDRKLLSSREEKCAII